MTNQLPVQRYAAAGGVVVDAAGEQVLVLLRPKRMGPDGRPEVRLPKGYIEPGESRRQAALREVGEESGLTGLEILADLGHQTVEFDWKNSHYIRDESYFLMLRPSGSESTSAEKQFRPQWLAWEEALTRLTFKAEREWVQRARRSWSEQHPRT